MRVKIEDMRDWLRDYFEEEYKNTDGDERTQLELAKAKVGVDEWDVYEVAEEYVRIKFNDKKI